MALLIIYSAALVGGWIFPWWWPALVAYGVGFWFPKNASNAFAVGFLGTATSWLTWAAFFDFRNHQILSGRMASLFHLPTTAAVLAVTALIGGITGGIAAWAGFAFGAYLKPKFNANS